MINLSMYPMDFTSFICGSDLLSSIWSQWSKPTKSYNVTKSMFQVSVINIEDATILYQKQFECRLSGGIASLQFEIYSHNGYDKDILIAAMEDSSIFIIEEENGKLLNPNPVQTDKPSKALLLQMLGALYGTAYLSVFVDKLTIGILSPCRKLCDRVIAQ
jgi:hypothetical protein